MPPDPHDPLPLWILSLGAVALAFVLWTGCWRPSRLAAGPDRPSDLQPWDLLVAFGLMIVGQLIVALLVRQLLGGANPATLSTSARAGLVLLNQVLGQGPPVAYFIWRAMNAPPEAHALGLRPRRPGRELGLAGVALLVALPLVFSAMILAIWIGQRLGYPPPELGHPLLEVLRDSESPVGVALLMGSVTLLGPALEEVLYRGLLQSALLAWLGVQRRVGVILLASGLFTVMHVGVPWQAMPGLFVLALVLGWLYERTGSLWPSILVHAGFNAFNAGQVLLMV